MSQLVDAKVNSGNRKTVLASNYPTRIRERLVALQECIMYKVICLSRKTIKLHTHSFRYAKQRNWWKDTFFRWFTWLPMDKKSVQFSFHEPPYFFTSRRVLAE